MVLPLTLSTPVAQVLNEIVDQPDWLYIVLQLERTCA